MSQSPVSSASSASAGASGPVAPRVDLSGRRGFHNFSHKLARVAWSVVWILLFRPSPRPLHRWRNFLLRCFGARLHPTARVYPAARVWAPWNLTMAQYSTLGDDVICYCVDHIDVGPHTVVSQYAFLCTAGHDYEHPHFPLVTAPIRIGAQVWIAADVFVAPGVSIAEGTVVGARSSVFKDLPAWKVCAGSPAKPIRDRVIRSSHPSPPSGGKVG